MLSVGRVLVRRKGHFTPLDGSIYRASPTTPRRRFLPADAVALALKAASFDLSPGHLRDATIRELGHPTSRSTGGFPMHRRILTLFALVLALSAPALAQEHPEHAAPAKAKSAVLMTGYGNWRHPVSTKNAQAQAFFDQGLPSIMTKPRAPSSAPPSSTPNWLWRIGASPKP
jgi:hypothetical protein